MKTEAAIFRIEFLILNSLFFFYICTDFGFPIPSLGIKREVRLNSGAIPVAVKLLPVIIGKENSLI